MVHQSRQVVSVGHCDDGVTAVAQWLCQRSGGVTAWFCDALSGWKLQEVQGEGFSENRFVLIGCSLLVALPQGCRLLIVKEIHFSSVFWAGRMATVIPEDSVLE